MKKFISFLSTGQIQSVGVCVDDDLPLQPGYPDLIMEVSSNSDINWNTHYVENGQIHAMPAKPSGEYKFDYTSKTWQQNVQKQSEEVKMLRSALLTASDWTQIPNNPLSSEKQTAWATYRQQLRDIPTQSGYPYNVSWPVAPT
jgi:hypothetical protein